MSTRKKTNAHNEDEEAIDVTDTDVEEIIDDESDAGRAKKDRIAALKEKLKHCEKEKQQYLDSWQREKAEFLNARRRDEESKQRAIRQAQEGVISSLLPALDSFEIACADTESYRNTPQEWRNGVEGIYAQLLSALESHNVSPFSPEGEPFDPTYHEAVEQVPVTHEAQDNTVIEVVQKGYRMDDRLIRSAKVKVGQFKQE
ncbi:MAG: nucleotide exchange factor GrpE [Candidatus Paceibacterota bacterium]